MIGGVELADLSDPETAAAAIETAEFVVNLEVRASEVSPHADVVFPIAPVSEKAGSFVDWEGRVRPFDKVIRDSNALPDLRVLAGIADEMGVDLGFRTVDQARAQMQEIGAWDGDRAPFAPDLSEPVGAGAPTEADNSVRVATWKLLLDDGRMLDGDDYLKATARTPVALLSQATLTGLGLTVGQPVTVTGERGSVRLPVAVADLPHGVVWTPTTSTWSAPAGSVVRLEGDQA